MDITEDKFVPFQNVPGPRRLEMPVPDNSGAVNSDIQFIADRLAILNHVSAYAYLIDEGRYEEFLDLFSDDIVFETTVPSMGTMSHKGKQIFRAGLEARYVEPSKTSTAVRRHTMGNIHVASQTATAAEVRSYLLTSSVPAADKLEMITSGTFNATLEKRNNKWIITRWYISLDAPVKPTARPLKGVEKGAIKFIRDPRFQSE